MSIFICEKCGKLDNTALKNNYWLSQINKNRIEKGEEITPYFESEYAYFNDHCCCSDCCNGLKFADGSGEIKKSGRDIENKKHWSEYGKEKLLEWESRNDGSMVNAREYFKSNNI